MNIPDPNDSWLVIGPGRSGSKVIVDIFCKLYLEYNLELKLHRADSAIDTVDKLTIYHSHNLADFEFADRIMRCVLSTRDIVDSAISWCIQPHIGEWHLYPRKHKELRERLEKNIPSFYLDPEIFLFYHEQIVDFYTRISAQNLSNFIVIDYEEFKNNQYEILGRLNYRNELPITGLPTKNPGTYKQWITNWDEISTLSLALERNPRNICKQLEK